MNATKTRSTSVRSASAPKPAVKRPSPTTAELIAISLDPADGRGPSEVPGTAAHAAAAVRPALPTTCGSWVKAHADHADAKDRLMTCKRLPRHHGECRTHKTLAAEHRAAAPKRAVKRVGGRSKPRVTRVDFMANLAADLEAGRVTPSAALAKASAFITAASRKPATKSAPKPAVVA